MKDSAFVTTEGRYMGNASWSGNVWSTINEMVVRGLCDCNENELASELALKTIYGFNHNCAEFINPFDGKGHGVLQYAWTASQYVELIVETIFGVSYCRSCNKITVSPRIPRELKDERLELKNLRIAHNLFLDVTINKGEIICKASSDSVKVEIVQR